MNGKVLEWIPAVPASAQEQISVQPSDIDQQAEHIVRIMEATGVQRLIYALCNFLEDYNGLRPHRALRLRPLPPRSAAPSAWSAVVRPGGAID